MKIQIFGKTKCFDTKKAERYFKERKIKFQRIDLVSIGISKGEFRSVKSVVGLENMIDEKVPGSEIIKHLADGSAKQRHYDDAKEEKILENPSYLKTPIVRNGKQATIGYCPNIWKTWE